jgi:hypothetical protein
MRPSFKVGGSQAKQRLGKLADQFADMIQRASEANTADIESLRNDYEKHLISAHREVCHCLASEGDVNEFKSQTELQLGSEPSRADERKAVAASAKRAYDMLHEWIGP